MEQKPIEHGPSQEWWKGPGGDPSEQGRQGLRYLLSSAAVVLVAVLLAVTRFHIPAVIGFAVSFVIAGFGAKLSPTRGTSAPMLMLIMVVVVLASLGLFVYFGLWMMELTGTPVLR